MKQVPKYKVGVNDHKKEFLVLLHHLGKKHNLFKVFQDFVEMSALAYASPVNRLQKPKIEERFATLRNHYSDEEYKILIEMLSELVEELQENPRDFLGEIFIELGFNNERQSQFFTPNHLATVLAKNTLGTKENIEQRIKKQGFISMSDPCCGAGATIIAAILYLKELDINYHKHVYIQAQDIDPVCFHMAYIQLSLLGVAATVVLGDSLTEESRKSFITPMYVMENWGGKKAMRAMNEREKALQEEDKKETATPEPVAVAKKPTPAKKFLRFTKPEPQLEPIETISITNTELTEPNYLKVAYEFIVKWGKVLLSKLYDGLMSFLSSDNPIEA